MTQTTLERTRTDESAQKLSRLKEEINKVVVGQSRVIDRVLVGLIAGGHILLEGVPGLAKTLTFQTLSESMSADFRRIQFTPDLLPSDLSGTTIYNPRTGDFSTRKGPLFANLILADEINRAPAKVQSALLEAMQEKQVTLGDKTFPLPNPFLVLATQNPIEQEGTYPLPEAQVDRFMLKVKVDYPSMEEEALIVERMTAKTAPEATAVMTTDEIIELREQVSDIYLDDKVRSYILRLVFATRNLDEGVLKGLITCGASPRASIALAKASRAHALLHGRTFVTPKDVKDIGFDVLRHRIVPSYEAEAKGLSNDDLLVRLFDSEETP